MIDKMKQLKPEIERKIKDIMEGAGWEGTNTYYTKDGVLLELYAEALRGGNDIVKQIIGYWVKVESPVLCTVKRRFRVEIIEGRISNAFIVDETKLMTKLDEVSESVKQEKKILARHDKKAEAFAHDLRELLVGHNIRPMSSSNAIIIAKTYDMLWLAKTKDGYCVRIQLPLMVTEEHLPKLVDVIVHSIEASDIEEGNE